MASTVFMSDGEHLLGPYEDAIWVTVILHKEIGPIDGDEHIMQYVVDQIKAHNVITGACSLSSKEAGCISIALPLNRVSGHYLGLLEHAEAIANWWLEQIRKSTIQLDRRHIFLCHTLFLGL